MSEISNFKLLTIQDIAYLVSYLQYLISFVVTKKNTDPSELNQAIINFCCDEIYDVISMVIFSVISIRKDNELQLRVDNLK